MRLGVSNLAWAPADTPAAMDLLAALGVQGIEAVPEADAEGLAAARLRILGDIAQAAGLTIALEPVPACYGADFLLCAADVRRLVRQCGHPAIRTHLDSACALLAGDGLADEIAATGSGGGSLAHYHIAEPDLGPFDAPSCPHAAAGDALRRAGYAGWLVIEMREQPGGLASLETAVRLAWRAYGVPGTARLC